ncbi:MAG: hypothetical protein R2752_17565 [Vicinamibacterales bacterium]
MPVPRVAMPAVALALLVSAGVATPRSAAPGRESPGRPPQAEVTRDALVAAATAYVTAYRRDFAFLVADETYLQSRMVPSTRTSDHRTMRGEMFLTYLEADGEWIAVHDVAEVDGTPVADRENLRDLLSKGAELRGLVGRVANRNARFNIGGVTRNFNEPTLPLLLFEAKRVHGVAFDLDRDSIATDASGATVATLTFRERDDGATLVRGPQGRIRSRGEVTIEAGTGRVRRTVLTLEQGPVTAELTTAYAHDENVDLWVPVYFTERYTNTSGRDETVTCSARYTNYRRFSVSGRIKGDGGTGNR